MIGTPEVLRARTAREFQQLKSDPTGIPIAAREFSRTDRLIIRVPAYGPGGTTPALSVHLLNRAGSAMSELAPAAAPTDREQQVELPLAALAPGEYVVEIKATGDGRRRHGTVGFRVTELTSELAHAARSSRILGRHARPWRLLAADAGRRRRPGISSRSTSARSTRAAGPWSISNRETSSSARKAPAAAAVGPVRRQRRSAARGAAPRFGRPTTSARPPKRQASACSPSFSTSTTSPAAPAPTASVKRSLRFVDHDLDTERSPRGDEAARLDPHDSPDRRSRRGAPARSRRSTAGRAATSRGTPTSASSWRGRRRESRRRASRSRCRRSTRWPSTWAAWAIARKTLVVVSEEIGRPERRRGRILPTLDTIVRSANRANVSVYPLDPERRRGRAAADAEVIRSLAPRDRRRASPADLEAGLKRAVADSTAYYLLTYRRRAPDDGKFRGVEVRVDARGRPAARPKRLLGASPDEALRAAILARLNEPKAGRRSNRRSTSAR